MQHWLSGWESLSPFYTVSTCWMVIRSQLVATRATYIHTHVLQEGNRSSMPLCENEESSSWKPPSALSFNLFWSELGHVTTPLNISGFFSIIFHFHFTLVIHPFVHSASIYWATTVCWVMTVTRTWRLWYLFSRSLCFQPFLPQQHYSFVFFFLSFWRRNICLGDYSCQ